MRESTFFHRLFFIFFFGSLVQIGEGEHKLGPLALQQRGPQLRNDPVAHLTAEHQTELARVSSNDIGLILTRISATFGALARDVSSKWQLDSRNVAYGIFAAPPQKRAK